MQSIETRAAKTLAVGNAAKVHGQLAQGCKHFHSVPPFQDKGNHHRLYGVLIKAIEIKLNRIHVSSSNPFKIFDHLVS